MPKPARRVARLSSSLRAFFGSRFSSATVTFSVFAGLSRSTFTGTAVPGLGRDDHVDEVVVLATGGR